MSQSSAILADLRAGLRITQLDALRLYGSSRLAARIDDVRKVLEPDEDIVAEMITVPSGKRVARYSLVRRKPSQVTLW